MKKILFSIYIIILGTCIELKAQPSMSLGMNHSIYSTNYTPFFGKQPLKNGMPWLSLSFGIHYPLKNKWYYEPGLDFAWFGNLNDNNGLIDDVKRVEYRVFTAGLDNFFGYQIHKNFSISASPFLYGIAFADTYWVFQNNLVSDVQWKDQGELNRFVFAAKTRATWHFHPRWEWWFNYRYDLTTAGRDDVFSRDKNLRGMGFTSGFKFNFYKRRTL